MSSEVQKIANAARDAVRVASAEQPGKYVLEVSEPGLHLLQAHVDYAACDLLVGRYYGAIYGMHVALNRELPGVSFELSRFIPT